MKKYMLVYIVDGVQEAMFGDDYYVMSKSKMDIECGLGGYCELYERTKTEDGMEYIFVEA